MITAWNLVKTIQQLAEGVTMTDRAHELLDFWFGNLGSADLPTSDRTTLWFGENEAVRKKMIETFQPEYEAASAGSLPDWEGTPRGRLALIILLDQFPRYIHHRSPQAFAYDEVAQKLCADGLREKMDLKDRKILYLLNKNARFSDTAIANILKMKR